MKKIFLVGLANAGKSTIFNALTKSHVHTGNWHGVTTDSAKNILEILGEKYAIYDLPGVYSLTPFTPEESVTVREILNNQDALIVNIIDANNLARSLNLTVQLLELGLKVVVGLNFFDDAKKRGIEIDISALQNSLNCIVLPLSLKNKKLIEIFSTFIKQGKKLEPPKYIGGWQLERVYNSLNGVCKPEYNTYNAIRLREGAVDEIWGCEPTLNEQANLRNFAFFDGVKRIYVDRQKNIDKILEKCLINEGKIPYGSNKLDKIILNKYLALPCFLFVMLAIFFITFGYIGDILCRITEYLAVDVIGGGIIWLFNLLSAPIWLIDFFNQALIGGLGSIFGFLPQVVLLFLFLEILEQSGYISRLAWTLDSLCSRLGLSGRSVFSLLMGFGCSTTAIPTTKTIKNDNARKKTVLLIPYMSCSAKLPVYSALAGAFFGVNSVFIIFGLYLLGVGVAILLAFISQKIYPTITNIEVLEFTPMRMPSAKKVFSIVSTHTLEFLARIWKVLLACTIIIWFLDNLTLSFSYITDENAQNSILESIAKILAPIFAPLGFGWGAVCALLFGLVAKELTLSGIAILNNVSGSEVASSILGGGIVSFTPASVLSFLVFCLLYSPCISALIQVRNNVPKKMFWWYIVGQFCVAYIFALITYGIASLVTMLGLIESAWLCLAVVVVFIVLEIFIISLINKKNCGACNYCKINRK